MVKGHRLTIDLNRKNHFIGLFEKADGENVAVAHCSAPEFRTGGDSSLGLSWIESKTTRSLMRRHMTTLGEVKYLIDDDAEDFYRLTEDAAAFATAKRREILESVLGPVDVIYDALHQGYYSRGMVALGAQAPTPSKEYVYLLGPHENAYLVREHRRPGESVDLPANLAVVPHGGGYNWLGINAAEVDYDATHGFRLSLSSIDGVAFITRSLDGMPVTFRGDESLELAEGVGLCERLTALRPIATLRN